MILFSDYFGFGFTTLNRKALYIRKWMCVEVALKEAMSRYFESFSATCKITFNVKETTKYQFGKTEKHQDGKNKPKTNEDG